MTATDIGEQMKNIEQSMAATDIGEQPGGAGKWKEYRTAYGRYRAGKMLLMVQSI